MKRRLLRSIRRNKDGATAVEFALVVPIFFMLVFSILEAGWFFFVDSAVNQAAANAARLIRTGQAQDGISKDDFYNEICNIVDTFGSCDELLTIDIKRFGDFNALAADLSSQVCRDQDDPTIEGAQFSEADYGVQREIVRVRVCLLYKPINPAIGLDLKQTTHGFRELKSVTIFRNEPFED